MGDLQHVRTERLRLDIPTIEDLSNLHAIYSDPRTWAHSPEDLQTHERTTFVMLAGWLHGWERDGLGPWIVRSLDDGTFLGNAGCWLRPGGWWNLGYAIAPDSRRAGLATEACAPALTAAREVRPDGPVLARLLEHNTASRRVAERLGMTLVHRGPAEGAPDAVRLVYADREVTSEELAARLG
ncbi:GNAT family N-acetyltransferase [Janibacter terrae]|jgi:RimJ/RimL family protein N-acetyltransferase|uniref:GNAT family N-acetyltransferase n=1 Tax=Janibacter terrae TaxID=103817 RepID=A0ABZ2FIX7_9MICO|nr:GNAT family N-acetyltransferase [Janibacter terrae]MBA4085798.1 N-acetyltransferase [Kytococcus sp.]HCE60737.1 N-acetyltransferase [Janibacter terrae]